MEHQNLWVCPQCLAAIESREGTQATCKHYMDNDDDTPCDWCEDRHSGVLYELV